MPTFSNFSSAGTKGYGQTRTINRIWVDNFNRATTTSGLGNSSLDGQPWITTSGNWYINASGQAQSSVNYSISSAYMATPNITSATISGISGGAGITIWQQDAQNWYAVALTTVYSGFNYTAVASVYNSCLTNNPGGTGVYTGATGACGQYQCSTGTGYSPDSMNCSCGPVYEVTTCADCPSTTTCVQCNCYYSGGHGGCSQCCTTTPGAPNACAPCSHVFVNPGSNCACGNDFYYTYPIYCNYFYNGSGVQQCVNSTAGTCAGASNNVCGFQCIGGYVQTLTALTASGYYYQFNVLQSVSGIVSNIANTVLSSNINVVVVGSGATMTPIAPGALTVTTSGNGLNANAYLDTALQYSLGNLTISGTGVLGDFVGIINVPITLSGVMTTVDGFYGQV